MKCLLINHSDINGGAARAAYRLHSGLRNSGIDSQMMVNVAALDDFTVHGPINKWGKALSRIRPSLAAPLRKLLFTENQIIHSPAVLASRWPRRINASDADVVNLHWVQEEMLSIPDITRIHKPIVWTLHDMWAFCGAEHYSSDKRWRDGYLRKNRPTHESGFDLNRHTWQRKRKHWRRPIHIVCPSRWLANCVRQSSLMHNWPVTVIPNPIDTVRWQPIEQRLARNLWNLPQNCPLLLFGAMGGSIDQRKGIDLLISALSKISDEPSLHNLQLVVFGQLTPQSPPHISFPVHYVGHLHDDMSLRVLYSAADALVLPSRQDNLPNTGLEAHACGTPVIAFKIGGLPDIVKDGITGALAEPFEPLSLAASIKFVLENQQRREKFRTSARERAVRLWSENRIASLYADYYKMAISSYTKRE